MCTNGSLDIFALILREIPLSHDIHYRAQNIDQERYQLCHIPFTCYVRFWRHILTTLRENASSMDTEYISINLTESLISIFAHQMKVQ